MNAGTTMRARSDVRSRMASLVTVTLFIGLAGAVSMGAFAGARRAESVYPRLRASMNEPAVVIFGGKSCPFSQNLDLAAMSALPEVVSMQPAWTTFVNVTDTQGRPLLFPKNNFDATLVSSDASDPNGSHPRLLTGRYPQSADEAFVGWGDTGTPGRGDTGAPRPVVGDTIEVTMIKAGSADAVFSGKAEAKDFVKVPLTVVGIALNPGELDGSSGSIGVLSPFADRYRGQVIGCEAGLFHLRHDLQDIAAFWTGAKAIAPGAFGFDTATERTVVERTTSLQAVMLRLFGALAALAALLVLGQVLVRRTLLAATDAPVLRALGMSRGQLLRAALLPAAAVAVAAAVLAVVGAVAFSVLTPLGSSRIFEPSPGVFVDARVLAIGAAVILVVVLACVGIPAWRTATDMGTMLGTTEYAGGSRPSRTASALASIGMPVSAVAGTRLALEPGHGRSATPVRSAIVGLTLAIAAMVAAFGFAASMDHFTSTPALWGIDYDFASGHPFIGSTFQNKALPIVAKDPGVGTVTAGNFQEQIGLVGPSGRTQSVAVWGTQVVKGDQIDLTMLEGRWPQTSGEIALGLQTARALGVSVGDTVQAQLEGATKDLTVVGVPVFPDFGFGPGLGQGAGTTMELLHTFYPDATLNLLFARFAPGADHQATLDRLNAQLRKVSHDIDINPKSNTALGVSLTHTRKSRELPLILASLFGIVALATLIHVLVTSVRQRRRDLAILRTIGFRRRQIAVTIAWQATTIAVIALLIGVPLGFLVGRFTWALFADRLGVVAAPVEAWESLLIVVPVVLVLANLVSIGPALFARRTQPAQILRAE